MFWLHFWSALMTSVLSKYVFPMHVGMNFIKSGNMRLFFSSRFAGIFRFTLRGSILAGVERERESLLLWLHHEGIFPTGGSKGHTSHTLGPIDLSARSP